VDPVNDSANLLLLLNQLRSSLDVSFNSTNNLILLTMAVATQPFFVNGQPMSDTSAYASLLDWVFVMAYDMYSGSSITGPNAPLRASTDQLAQPMSYTQALDAWINSHMPANKIVMGIALYGHAMKPKQDMSNAASMIQPAESTVPQGDSDDTKSPDGCKGKIYDIHKFLEILKLDFEHVLVVS
jgi:chitinase